MSTPPLNPYAGAPTPPLSAADEKLWATLIHLSPLVVGFLGPLVGYLVLRDRGPFVRFHCAQALNLQLTSLIGYVASFALTFVLIGFFTYFAVLIVALIFMIMSAMRANQGLFWPIPATIRFVQ